MKARVYFNRIFTNYKIDFLKEVELDSQFSFDSVEDWYAYQLPKTWGNDITLPKVKKLLGVEDVKYFYKVGTQNGDLDCQYIY